jgi:hypothetical protein
MTQRQGYHLVCSRANNRFVTTASFIAEQNCKQALFIKPEIVGAFVCLAKTFRWASGWANISAKWSA